MGRFAGLSERIIRIVKLLPPLHSSKTQRGHFSPEFVKQHDNRSASNVEAGDKQKNGPR
ncbi:MAG TPA: hypothetical protein VJ974_08030 [Geopsychrobacteraceae bacterium]|nr:hypothetical protein [Geopsychrobacteraceae bacterium]